MSKLHCFFILCCVCAVACSSPDPWPNARRYQKTQTEIFYQAPVGAAESIQAAWLPQSVLSISDNLLIYADAGTKKIVQLNTKNSEQMALFDFSNASVCQYNQNTSGLTLLQADKDWLFLANSTSSLYWFNLSTGEIKSIGNIHPANAMLPEDGVRLGDIDFELFSGIGKSKSGFYMVFANQIFHVPWNGNNPDDLLNAPVELIAGSMDDDNAQNTASTDAKSASLNLTTNLFTNLTEHNGWLYFWEYRSLRAVRDGKIALITGDGYTSPSCALEEFYAQALSSVPQLVSWQNHLFLSYWGNNGTLLQIDVDEIDMVNGTATGYVTSLYPQAGSMDALTASTNGLVSADLKAGSFWQIELVPEISSKRIFGPETEELRTESLFSDAESPYAPGYIIAPMAILSILNQTTALVYSPTIEILSALNLNSLQSAPVWKSSFSHFISDDDNRIWLADNSTLNILEIDDNGNLLHSYVSNFFRKNGDFGMPCTRETLDLPEIQMISAANDKLLLFSPDTNNVLQWNKARDEVSELQVKGWSRPSSLSSSEFSNTLAFEYIEHWTAKGDIEVSIYREDDRQYIYVANLSAKTLKFDGNKIPYRKMIRISGTGPQKIADGILCQQTYSNDITAAAIDNFGHLIIARPGEIFTTSDYGVWKSLSATCPLPENSTQIRDLVVIGNPDNYIFAAKIGDAYHACSQKQTSLKGTALDSTWKTVDIEHIASCDSSLIAYVNNQQLCLENIINHNHQCLSLPNHLDIYSLTCDETSVYLSGVQDDASLIWFAPLNEFNHLQIWGGQGDGLPWQIPIQNALLGNKLGGMSIDGIPNLYFWMKDTCTIWKLPVYKNTEFEGDILVSRIFTNQMLCEADAFAASFDSTLAFIHQNTLYRIENEDVEPLGELDGEVIEMISMGYGFVIMTTKGLYTWENDRLIHKADGTIAIDGETIHYAVQDDVHPRMMQSPGENAVLIPVFEGDRIIKIAL